MIAVWLSNKAQTAYLNEISFIFRMREQYEGTFSNMKKVK